MFDANTHLHFDALWDKRDAVLAEARDAGITGVLVSATELSRQSLERLRYFDAQGAAIAVGWHPQSPAPDDAVDQLEAVLIAHPHWCVGEIGVDTRYSSDTALFEAQLTTAARLGRPCVVHAVGKGALSRAFDICRGTKGARGFIHAFSGSPEQARAFIQCGWKLSIGGPLLHPNRPRLESWVRAIPLGGLLVESDSPDLPPRSWEGANRPLSVVQVLRRIAALRGQSLAEVAAATTRNAEALGLRSSIVMGRV